MSIIYETPDKTWQVREQNDSLWQEVFGKDVKVYHVCKHIQSLAIWNEANPESKLTDYALIHSFEKPEYAFRWLKTMNVISRDEMLYQIKILSKV